MKPPTFLRPNLDVYNKNIITVSNSNQKKTLNKKNNLYFARKDIGPVVNATS